MEKRKLQPGEMPCPFVCFTTGNLSGRPYVSSHWHDYIEIIYVMYGEMRVSLNNQFYNLFEGDLILIDSNVVHSTDIKPEVPTECIVLKFEPDMLSANGNIFEMRYVLPFINAGYSHKQIFLKEELANTNIPELITAVYKESVRKEYGYELAVRAGIYNIFLWILRNSYDEGLKSELQRIYTSANIEKLQKVLKHVELNYAEEIETSAMAELCRMNYHYFSRVFKKVMGKTFKEYLNFIRISQAERLLLSTDLNITEIALCTGFSNSSYFIKQFKYYKHFSPKQWRMKIQPK